jgi:hypothetical protein
VLGKILMIAFVFLGSFPELLNQPLEDFIEYFNQFYDSESWQKHGVSAHDLKQWCVQNGMAFILRWAISF